MSNWERVRFKVGQIVQYRPWQPGDVPVESVEPRSRGWDRTGIVIRICDWANSGNIELGAGVEYLSQDGDIILAHKKDLIIINQPTRGSD